MIRQIFRTREEVLEVICIYKVNHFLEMVSFLDIIIKSVLNLIQLNQTGSISMKKL